MMHCDILQTSYLIQSVETTHKSSSKTDNRKERLPHFILFKSIVQLYRLKLIFQIALSARNSFAKGKHFS